MDRPDQLARIHRQFEVNPVVAVLGPRQCGKTTLARMYAEGLGGEDVTVFDLEDPNDLGVLERPKLALEELTGLVVIDEVQRAPGLFEVLRVLVDRDPNPSRFLILGSASRDLLRQSSETLAGRISHLELTPFTVSEVGADKLSRLWLRGGYPRSFLAKDDGLSAEWRQAFITTFLERDVPSLGINIPPRALRRFWMMVAHYHGQLVNYSELGRSFGAADTTIRRYLEILVGTFMLRQLPAWFENIKKRQVKAPKIYFRDSGIFHSLIGVDRRSELNTHPKLGASWEGLALEEIIRLHGAEGDCYFWSVYGRAELDLLLLVGGRRLGFDVKYTDSPRVTRSMLTARDDLRLDDLTVVVPGTKSIALEEGIRAVGMTRLLRDA